MHFFRSFAGACAELYFRPKFGRSVCLKYYRKVDHVPFIATFTLHNIFAKNCAYPEYLNLKEFKYIHTFNIWRRKSWVVTACRKL